MGLTANCTIEARGETFEAKALLESNELIVRGEHRFRIPFGEIRQMNSAGGRLAITTADNVVVLYLGDAAVKWEVKIRNPPSLLNKLGCKAGLRAKVVGQFQQEFITELESAGIVVAGTNVDLLFFQPGSTKDLSKFISLKRTIKPAGAIWVVFPKGVISIRESDVMRAAKDAGLVDVKVASFSTELTAIKLLIPVRDR